MIGKIMKIAIGIVGMLIGFGVTTILKALEILKFSNNGWSALAIYLGFSLFFLELYFFYFISYNYSKR